ncbi:uncharacterized protein isoform X2 [Leptinotarsa decemlineata]|uniref:uncharacterized protein isoform X2 n=1 Tax=Leptinotarsa decemlineata TaxID=7539 RepID=UPI003D307BA7
MVARLSENNIKHEVDIFYYKRQNIERKMPKFTARSVLAEIEMDEQFMEVFEKYNDKEMSPVEMDLKIQADRVIYVINRCMAKLSIMAHLPFLLENDGEIIRKYMKHVEASSILQLVSSWGVDFKTNISTVTIPEELLRTNPPIYPSYMYGKTGGRSSATIKSITDAMTDPQILHMVDILFYSKCLRAVIAKADNPPTDRNLMNLIKTFQDLKAVAKSKVYVSGQKEEARNKELRRAYKSNELLTVVIEDLKEQLEKQRKELGDQLDQKVGIFEKYHKKMETIMQNFEIQMKRTLHKSEEIMMHKTIKSDAKQAELSEEAKKLVNQYETLLADHLDVEKAARSKRFKTETQLQNWLASYDQDIGERQTQYEVLKKEYDEKKKEMDKFEELIDEQEEEYIRLMEEKRLEEERIYNEMAYHFLMNRSARKIQRYWRAYRERRARRRGKKGKGKEKKKKVKEPVAPKKATVTRTSDPNLALASDRKIKDHVFEELENKDPDLFQKSTPTVM